MKKIVLILTLSFSFLVNGQSSNEKVFESESKWCFSQINPYIMDSVYVKDTIIEQQIYQSLVQEFSSPLYYKQGDSLMFNNEGKEYLAFDYSLNEGDSIKLAVFGNLLIKVNGELISADTVVHIKYKLVSLESVIIGGDSYRIFNMKSDDEFMDFLAENQFQFIENVGCTNCWSLFPSISPHTTADKAHRLRCYKDSVKEFTTDFWLKYEKPCNYNLVTSTEDNLSEIHFQIYPTNISDSFVIKPQFENVVYNLEILNSKGISLLEQNFNGTTVISVSQESGLYLVRVRDNMKVIFNQKITKQ